MGLLAVFLVFVAIIFVVRLLTFRPKSFPPGPASLPLIGDILTIKRLLTELKSYHLVWQHFSKLHGSIVGLKMIKDYVIVVSGIENIKKFSALPELDGRPNGFFFRIRSFGKRLGIVFTDGLFWEEQRNFSVKALKLLGLGKLSMVEHIEREAKELVIALQKGEKNVVVVQGEDTNLFDISVMNVMWTIMRGKRFELHDECLVNLMEMVHKNFKIIDMSGGLLSQLPWIRFVAPTLSGYRTTVETMKPLWQFLDENIQQIFSNYDVHDEPSNFIESYCREMHNQPNVSTFSREQLLALCIDFFQAGSETTSNTLTFGLLYMLHYPHVMKQIQKELDEVVGSRFPALSDRKNLKYVQATLAEIQRMASVAPVGIAHRTLSEVHVDRYTIPKDAIVLFNVYGLNMDEKYWKHPNVFNPERFLNNDGDLINHENFIPFGLGMRRCIGENLAKTSLFLFFTTFLHFFDIEPAAGLPDTVGRDGITLSPKPFKVKTTKRRDVIIA